MKLTKKEAIKEHRKMWGTIAYETFKNRKPFTREMYFNKYLPDEEIPFNKCYLCDYANKSTLQYYYMPRLCACCPVKFMGDGCHLYCLWSDAVYEQHWIRAYIYAKLISMLPERKIKKKTLTKKEAIKEHRNMWNWIADELENGNGDKYSDASQIKIKYLKRNKITPKKWPQYNCYCCEYACTIANSALNDDKCAWCPIEWPGGCCAAEDFNSGLYDQFTAILGTQHDFIEDYQAAAKIARQIANLPERKDV